MFSGVAGIELGLEWTGGFKTVWQVEIDEYRRQVLKNHFPGVRRPRDVRTFLTRPHSQWACDLICGGFPCQNVSQAGKGGGLDGEQSGLWTSYRNAIRDIRPPYVLVENVPALRWRRPGIERVLGDLASLGYDARWESLPAKAFGAPFEGDRVYICAANGTRCENSWLFDIWPEPEPGTWWLSEPGVCRVADGVSGQVGGGGGNVEVAALADSVVPWVAKYLGERILEAEHA